MFRSNDISKFKAFNTAHAYQLRLEDDEEILSKANTVYSAQHLISKNHTLDSGIFGATLMNPICDVCYNRVENCPGHFAVIQLPFPIIRAICLKDFKILISLICPICSHILSPNASKATELAPENRLAYIKKEVEKYTKNGESVVICPTCGKKVTTIKIIQQEPSIRICVVLPQQNISDQINPCQIYTMLQNFSQINEIGFSSNYHPKNFMTTLIPIIPNKLRPKTIISSESTLTSYYRVIIEELCPELNKLYKTLSLGQGVIIDRGDMTNTFNKYYDKLMAYYLLITDMGTEKTKELELTLIEKRDRKHVDIHNSLIGRLKGKEKSIYQKGIISTRHNISGRTVLGGTTSSPVVCINVPGHIASKLTMLYPVYEQNLKAMQQLVAAMANPEILNDIHIPRVLGIVSQNATKMNKITIKDAITKAALLRPGDKLAITLLNTDLIMQVRFPSIREESWSCFQVIKDDNTIISLPLSVCKMKQADFDGDEANIYIPSSHVTDIEALMLHSPYQQLIAHKNGNLAVWYSADAPYGIMKMKQKATSLIYNDKLCLPELDVIKTIESFIPPDLTYIDGKTEIVKGKLPSNKTDFKNFELHKYMISLYGPVVTSTFMDKIIQLSYDLNRDYGNTMGFEIRIYGDESKKEIAKIVDKLYEEMKLTEQSNTKYKDILQISAPEKKKSRLKEILLNSSRGSNISNLGIVDNKQEEYFQTVVLLDHVLIDSNRVQPILAEGSRVNCSFPRYSVDPCAYGFCKCSYNSDISPIAHFYELKQQRQALYQRGQGTAKQGYMSKKLAVAFGNSYADFNGATINNFRIISTQYGACGLNPRLYVVQPLIDISEKYEVFEKKYKSDKRLCELHKLINECRHKYSVFTTFTKTDFIKDIFVAGFNYEQYINNNVSKGETKQELINAFVDRVRDSFCPKGMNDEYILDNLNHHEYYFRIKLKQYDCSSVLDKLHDFFIWSLVDGGDPIGMKAAISTSEPLTQASLNAIHKAGGGGVNEEQIKRSMGLARFEELLGGNTCKDSVVTFKLYDDSKESSIAFANEQETFYFNNIWSRMEVNISKNIPKHVINLHPWIPLQNVEVNNYFVTSIWNVTMISSFNIHVVDIIDKLIENFNEIMFITGYVLNSTEFMAYIFFKPTIKIEQIQNLVEEWSQERASTIVHGKYLKNCYVSENKNRPGHYIISANEVNENSLALQNLIYDERVDPYGCSTTNPSTNLKMFGICEASTRHYEDLLYTAINLSVTNEVLHRHYKVLADTIYTTGEPQYASRNSLRHDRSIDVMRLVQFETAKDMIQQALRFGDIQPVSDGVSAAVFGELPTFGTGCSKVTLYST